jgi:hypothetical protein
MSIERETAPGENARPAIATVSHTLSGAMREELRSFAFEYRISESAVLEQALADFLESAPSRELAARLRASGHGLRRK